MEPTQVWMVALDGPDKHELEGTLTEDGEGLVFTQESSSSIVRLAYSEVAKVRRVMGSPVFIVRWGPDRHDTAFYLTKPPPLGALGGRSERLDTSLPSMSNRLGGTGKWRRRRENVRYLSATSTNVREIRDAWVTRIRARVKAASGSEGA